MTGVGDVEMMLEEWLQLLDIKEQGDIIMVHPKSYLGPELFNKILSVVVRHGGRYVSKANSKDGRAGFKFPKVAQVEVKVAGVLYCPHCGNALKVEKA